MRDDEQKIWDRTTHAHTTSNNWWENEKKRKEADDQDREKKLEITELDEDEDEEEEYSDWCVFGFFLSNFPWVLPSGLTFVCMGCVSQRWMNEDNENDNNDDYDKKLVWTMSVSLYTCWMVAGNPHLHSSTTMFGMNLRIIGPPLVVVYISSRPPVRE